MRILQDKAPGRLDFIGQRTRLDSRACNTNFTTYRDNSFGDGINDFLVKYITDLVNPFLPYLGRPNDWRWYGLTYIDTLRKWLRRNAP